MKILVVYTVGIKSEFEILFRGENVLSDHLLDNNETEEFSKNKLLQNNYQYCIYLLQIQPTAIQCQNFSTILYI
jgi:hypothetical protein